MAEDKTRDSIGLLYMNRLVPDGRKGNKVFARSLRPGEADTGEGVNVRAGEQLVIRAGGLVISSNEIDAQSPQGYGGYAPVANTVWTWYSIVGEQVGFFLYFYALARRLDAAHAAWELATRERENASSEGAIAQRIGFFRALSNAEVTIIALNRAMNMLLQFDGVFPLGLEIPDRIRKLEPIVKDMRDAFEHIDERAQGKINIREKMDAEALTIFNQPDFVGSSVLHYRGKTLHFHEDVLAALLSCRELVLKAIDLRANARAESGKQAS